MIKSSKNITLGLVITLASLVISCGSDTTRVCTDTNGNVVDSNQCNTPNPSGYYPYRWYYMRGGGVDPAIGSHAYGGSYSAPSGVSRGGFGGSAFGHGVGE